MNSDKTMQHDRSNRTALVMEASYGVGAGRALAFAEEGYNVAISATQVEYGRFDTRL
jgi:NAD(P)-dependent dehydrogenase (short-subunit alcohol dehydrogenase family)